MRKNKLVLVLSCVFSIIFLMYIVKLTEDIENSEKNLISSKNIVDVTNKITTKVFISESPIADQAWKSLSFNDQNWKEIEIPKYWIPENKDFKSGSYAYYRIHIPKEQFSELNHLSNETFLSLYYVLFSKVNVYVNGEFYTTNKPTNYNESLLLIPVKESIENIVSLEGSIKAGDIGISHRRKILLGRGAELFELHRSSYKGQTLMSLIFILCKGSILIIFTLIFLMVRVDRFFEKSLLFSIFVLTEDVLTGDYLSHLLNLNMLVFLYNCINIAIVSCLVLFLADVVDVKFKRKIIWISVTALSVISFLLAADVMFTSVLFNIDHFLKFWNCITLIVLAYFLKKMIKKDKVVFVALLAAFVLTFWTTFFAANIGHNLKALSNLLIFFVVAYQTFILFRKEQTLLIEQEKDVTIGKTAALLAHDVRRPLDQMNLILDRISSGDFSEEFLRIAKRDVEFSLNSVNNQINDIMNFSRTNEIALSPISLYSVLSGSLQQVMSIKKNIKINIEYDCQAHKKIMGDESRLSSVLTNLLSNAVEAIQDIGKRNVGLIKISTAVEGSNFAISITNDGPQIPTEILEDIFKPLFTHGKSNGTGLGLASVVKIVHEHKGTIECKNLKPSGVVFSLRFISSEIDDHFDLTLFKQQSDDYSYEIKPQVHVEEKVKPIRIFLLDDDKYVFEYISDLIKNISYDVELAYFNDFIKAQNAVKTKRFDLYILDYDLGNSRNGQDFYLENLSFLKDSVVLHTNRDSHSIEDLSLPMIAKPMNGFTLLELCDKAYSNRLKILLVEDSKLISIAWLMFHGKHNIYTVSSPEEALRFLESNVEIVDICVLDFYYETSQLNGEILGNQISQIYPEMKIYICTSSLNPDLRFPQIKKNEYDIRQIQQK